MLKSFLKLSGFLAALILLNSCFTSAKEKQINDEIFTLQTKVLELEQQVQTGTKETINTGEVAKKRLASTSSEIERLGGEIQRLKGDIDALKIGVTTGQMPGQESGQANSIASKMQDYDERLQAMEQQQVDVLAAIEKNNASAKKATKGKGDKTSDKADKGDKSDDAKGAKGGAPTLTKLKEAFDKKRFKQVVEDAPKVTKGTKGAEHEEAMYVYAESLYRLGKMREAALQYNDLLEGKPSPKFVPQAKMRMGDAYRNLGDLATAKIYYQELVTEFPQSAEADKARERMAELGKESGGKSAEGNDNRQGTAVKHKGHKQVATSHP